MHMVHDKLWSVTAPSSYLPQAESSHANGVQVFWMQFFLTTHSQIFDDSSVSCLKQTLRLHIIL